MIWFNFLVNSFAKYLFISHEYFELYIVLWSVFVLCQILFILSILMIDFLNRI